MDSVNGSGCEQGWEKRDATKREGKFFFVFWLGILAFWQLQGAAMENTIEVDRG